MQQGVALGLMSIIISTVKCSGVGIGGQGGHWPERGGLAPPIF